VKEHDLVQDDDAPPANIADNFQSAERVSQLVQHITHKDDIKLSNFGPLEIINIHALEVALPSQPAR
jgi:hypothetical protein